MIYFKEKNIQVRKLKDQRSDYQLFHTWLSDLDVCEYYEGRTKPFDYNMVLEKFQERAQGLDYVKIGIIEYDKTPIGFVQFYPTKAGEYHESDVIESGFYPRSYGMDIIIGNKNYWNMGIGRKTINLLSNYLFTEEKADIIFIAPQTWNKRAIRCYENSGFKAIKLIKNMELHDDELKDGLLMIRTRDGA